MPPKIEPHIAALPATIPFVGPEAIERASGKLFAARLGANEGNFGCSPMATYAMEKAAHDGVGKYCDPECYDLRHALGEHLGIDMNNVVAGPGIDGIMGLIVRLFSSMGDKIVTSLGGYPTFNFHVAGYGRQLITVPYRDDHEDLLGLAQAASRENAAIVYVANPDNPMGTWWPAHEIERFFDAVPDTTLILLDEAYGETAPAGTSPAIDLTRKNVLRTRTFSKAYGLAGLRCGYAFGHRDLIAPFEKIRDHFGVNIMAQMAAIAAVKDQEWLHKAVALNMEARTRISHIAVKAGFHPIQSATNFVAIDCLRDGAYASEILNGLLRQGIFVRKPMTAGLDRCIRVSAGNAKELDAFEAALSLAIRV
ncbi:MAG: pyridoxal phosphate-dependent aminotransferase [Ahrensia sp.]|nr:pyridoxal phosphate-dependent aminotransferase [Ahrensia sp.]